MFFFKTAFSYSIFMLEEGLKMFICSLRVEGWWVALVNLLSTKVKILGIKVFWIWTLGLTIHKVIFLSYLRHEHHHYFSVLHMMLVVELHLLLVTEVLSLCWSCICRTSITVSNRTPVTDQTTRNQRSTG